VKLSQVVTFQDQQWSGTSVFEQSLLAEDPPATLCNVVEPGVRGVRTLNVSLSSFSLSVRFCIRNLRCDRRISNAVASAQAPGVLSTRPSSCRSCGRVFSNRSVRNVSCAKTANDFACRKKAIVPCANERLELRSRSGLAFSSPTAASGSLRSTPAPARLRPRTVAAASTAAREALRPGMDR